MLLSRRLAALAVLLSATTAALAEGPMCYPDADCAPAQTLNSGRTRAAVVAAMSEPAYVDAPSTLTRAAVIAEYYRARDRGEMALVDEDSGSTWLAMERANAASHIRTASLRLLAAR